MLLWPSPSQLITPIAHTPYCEDLMASLTHCPTGWRVIEFESVRDEKGQESKRAKHLCCLAFGTIEDAVAYFRVVHPDCMIDLRCDCCGKAKNVTPEEVGTTYVLTCKGCASVTAAYSPPSEAEKGKLLKHPRVIHELKRNAWLKATRKEVLHFEMDTTGHDALDRALCLPKASKPQPPIPVVIEAEDAPTECQVCDCPITDKFVDGVIVSAGWAYLCLSCHKSVGIGLGTGRGQQFVRIESGQFVKGA